MKTRVVTGLVVGMLGLGLGMGCGGVDSQANGALDSAGKADGAAGSEVMRISTQCSHHSDQIEVTRNGNQIIVNIYTYARGEKLTVDLGAGEIVKDARDTSGAVKTTRIAKADEAFPAELKKATAALALIAKGNACTSANPAAIELLAYLEALTAKALFISSQCSHHSEQINILDGETTLTFQFTSASPNMTKLILNKNEATGIFQLRRDGSGAYTKKLITAEDKATYVTLLDRAFNAAELVKNGNPCTKPNEAAGDIFYVTLPGQLLRPSAEKVSGDSGDDVVKGPFGVKEGSVVLAELIPSGSLTLGFYAGDQLLQEVDCRYGPTTNPTCNAIAPKGATKVDFRLTGLEMFGYELNYDLGN